MAISRRGLFRGVSAFALGAGAAKVASLLPESPVAIQDAVGGTGSGATAVAQVAYGAITSITMINPGSGYTDTPTITFRSA